MTQSAAPVPLDAGPGAAGVPDESGAREFGRKRKLPLAAEPGTPVAEPADEDASAVGAVKLSGIPVVDHLNRSDLLLGQRTGEIGMLHSWELVTAVDGPGTRMTTFVAGCPLRCLYCHNPDTISTRHGLPVRAGALLKRIKRYRGVFKATGGGMTMSGGEALAQPAFVRRVFAGAKEMGVHTALDTSGFLGRYADDAMLADIDLVLLDVKAGDEETYGKVTGRALEPTLEFGRRLSEAGVETWIRFVLVPGLTDHESTIEPIADYAATLSAVTRVEILPFHQMGSSKWAELGMTYLLADTKPPTPELVERVRGIFRARGLATY